MINELSSSRLQSFNPPTVFQFTKTDERAIYNLHSCKILVAIGRAVWVRKIQCREAVNTVNIIQISLLTCRYAFVCFQFASYRKYFYKDAFERPVMERVSWFLLEYWGIMSILMELSMVLPIILKSINRTEIILLKLFINFNLIRWRNHDIF